MMQSSLYLLTWIAGVAALWLLWDIGIKKLLLDLFRERVFELRFELFRLGLSGELPFDSDTYRTLETLLCGLLRFGHRVTFMTFIFSKTEQDKARRQKDYVDVGQQISLQISRLDPSVQKKLGETLDGVRTAIVLYAAFTSLFFLVLFAALSVAQLLHLWRPDKAKVEFSGVIEREAYRAETRRALVEASA